MFKDNVGIFLEGAMSLDMLEGMYIYVYVHYSFHIYKTKQSH
jgi:hypothetical protein